MLVEGHLVEWLFLAKCVTLLKYCVNKIVLSSSNGFPVTILYHCHFFSKYDIILPLSFLQQ